MPIEEMIIGMVNELAENINGEDTQKKIELSKTIIALMYAYLRQLGLSQDNLAGLWSKEDTNA